VFQRVAECCSVLWCSVCCRVCSSVLNCVAVRCSALQCVAVCCSALQCVAVCCSVLQCVAVCCSTLYSCSRPSILSSIKSGIDVKSAPGNSVCNVFVYKCVHICICIYIHTYT